MVVDLLVCYKRGMERQKDVWPHLFSAGYGIGNSICYKISLFLLSVEVFDFANCFFGTNITIAIATSFFSSRK